MSKNQLTKVIRSELNWLNHIIDQKIVRGQSYRGEAKQHKMLLSRLSRI